MFGGLRRTMLRLPTASSGPFGTSLEEGVSYVRETASIAGRLPCHTTDMYYTLPQLHSRHNGIRLQTFSREVISLRACLETTLLALIRASADFPLEKNAAFILSGPMRVVLPHGGTRDVERDERVRCRHRQSTAAKTMNEHPTLRDSHAQAEPANRAAT
ncbi:hypothetical protein HPB49_000297 [Dermacentor silvarum]|uniref:Uncharacterized protein n=1 Tax=Dermacentor silvarum TaxID=543639 RepID=A0ACB8DRX6_DERSI|nr:hypothetical protein HPB49_000297 [Dermacentor silvarum]